MKQLFVCFIVLVMIFTLISCSHEPLPDREPPSDMESPFDENVNQEKDSEIVGPPARVRMFTWDELREMVQMAWEADDYESWIDYLDENANVDSSYWEKSGDPMSFEYLIKNIDVTLPVTLTDVELLSSYYTFDRHQFSLDCVYDGLVYRLFCQPTDVEFTNAKNENAHRAVASIGDISFNMYWNEEYHWYAGSFIHNDHTYNICVYQYENRASGTAAISEEWDFDVFCLMPLQEMIVKDYFYSEGIYNGYGTDGGKAWGELPDCDGNAVPNAQIAILIATEQLEKEQAEERYQGFVLSSVFYDTEDRVWVVGFIEPPLVPGGSYNVAIRQATGEILAYGYWGE